MKKLLIFSAVAGLILCVTAPVYAAQTEIGGQYRINYYNADQGNENNENQAAARLRFRPHLNATLNENVKAHLQLEIGHISSNLFTAGSSVETRHAYLDFALPVEGLGLSVRAGLIPWSDSFGDVLASSDWNYNPLGVGITAEVGEGKLRVGTYKEQEGLEAPAADKEDDIDLYVAEYDTKLPGGGSVGGSVYHKIVTRMAGQRRPRPGMV